MTDVTLDSALSSLAASAAAFNETSDKCNRVLRETEQQLVAFNIGIEHWHGQPLARTDPTGDIGPHAHETEVVTVLGFAKLLGKWCLAVKEMRLVSGFYQGNMDSPFQNRYAHRDPLPLVDAPRELRMRALMLLPEFVAGFVEVVQEANSCLVKSCEQLS